MFSDGRVSDSDMGRVQIDSEKVLGSSGSLWIAICDNDSRVKTDDLMKKPWTSFSHSYRTAMKVHLSTVAVLGRGRGGRRPPPNSSGLWPGA